MRAAAVLLLLLAGCAEEAPEHGPWASEVVAFAPGEGAGFGQAQMPQIVLGPPGPGTELSASLEVVSLGVGGEIVVGLGARAIVDGPGVDFVVFENPFWPGGSSEQVFAELGEVSVSADGATWHTFACAPQAPAEPGRWPGCAGWSPTRASFDRDAEALDPALSGGDGFDLAELGLAEARFVRVRDLSTSGAGPTAGFDLDAVGLVHYR